MKEYTHVDIASMKQDSCPHSDAVPDEPCPDCGLEFQPQEEFDNIFNTFIEGQVPSKIGGSDE
ncbi:unnamed protein product [marine sediment metagenome]|uniref:Uncharacterized protein n=1 Tax=marine sediment metagenome TaxID=412755 RepID=X1CNW0_9ZZZZ